MVQSIETCIAFQEHTANRWMGNGVTMQHFDVMIDGAPGGVLRLNSSNKQNLLFIHYVKLETSFRQQGYGQRMYTAIPDIPLGDGLTARDKNMDFVSSREAVSESALRVWDTLARHRKAQRHPDGTFSYIM